RVNIFSTIQAAVDAASAGDTINVSDGTYSLVTVNKTLTIQGNQFGVDAQNGRVGASETIVNGNSGDAAFLVKASNVVLDGFTVQGVTQQFAAGVNLQDGTSGSLVLNNIIQNNDIGIELANGAGNQTVIRANLIHNRTGIVTHLRLTAVTNVLIDNNTF